jgi:hypothetical protein
MTMAKHLISRSKCVGYKPRRMSKIRSNASNVDGIGRRRAPDRVVASGLESIATITRIS